VTKPAKELIAQNPPQDFLETQATLGLVFAMQSAVADVAGGSSGHSCQEIKTKK